MNDFCSEASYHALEQALGFPEILYTSRITYFYLAGEKGIVSFAQVIENFRFAHIWFGPVCDDKEMAIESVLRIADHYKTKGFWYIGIQPYRKSNYDADYIEYSLNKQLRITYLFTGDNTKSSLEIDLGQSLADIFSRFSKGHKSAVSKAIRSGITVQQLETSADLENFLQVYCKMNDYRGIGGHSNDELKRICSFILKNKCGSILLAKDSNYEVIGGSVFAFQGLSVRYLISASDPSRRELPVTHYIIYRAIEQFKEYGFRYFDFWGYNHFARPGEQIYQINKFKKGFGGYYIFFMKKMNISLTPGGFRLFRLYTALRKAKSVMLRSFRKQESVGE